MDDFEKTIDGFARGKKVNISRVKKMLDRILEEIKEDIIKGASE